MAKVREVRIRNLTMLTPLNSGQVIGQPITETHLLEAFADFLNIDVGAGDASLDTLATYKSHLKQFLAWCEHTQLHPALATREEVKRYRRFLIDEKHYLPATVALKLSVVRRFYDAAVEHRLIMVNPAIGIKPPREKRDRAEKVTYLEKLEVQTLLSAVPVDGTLKSVRDKLMLAIMALEGPRTVEIHRCNIADIVQQGSNWGIRVDGKCNIRVVPLTPDLAKALLAYLEKRKAAGEVLQTESPLFIAVGNRAGGQRISRRGIRAIVDKYLKATGLKHQPGRTLSTHSLRHTAGTLALRSGAELRQVQDLLGHKDPRTTTIYTHVADRWENNPALKLGITI
jgi:site-specific recombinase XerD